MLLSHLSMRVQCRRCGARGCLCARPAVGRGAGGGCGAASATAPPTWDGFADDYAHLISGLLDLYGASGTTGWLRFALRLQAAQDELFWDERAGAR